MKSARRCARVPIALAVLVLLVPLGVAYAAPNSTVKPYDLSASSASDSAPAGTSTTFTFTLTNWANPQTLGSANVSIPQFSVAAPTIVATTPNAPQATVATDGTTLFLRNLALAPSPSPGTAGGSITVSFTATASCAAGTYTWNAAVKQSNDFNGPPGNAFVLKDGSALPTATITGACRLAFAAQPADVVGPNVAITSEPLASTGAPVAVRLVAGDGTTATISGVPITLNLALNGGGGALNPTTPLATTSSGVATFAGISISKYGTYRLGASSPGVSSTTSTVFNVWDQVQPCTALDCTLDATAGSISTNGTAGYLGLSVGGRTKPVCSDTSPYHAQVPLTGNAYGNAANASVKTGVIVIPKKDVLLDPNNGASFYQVCYAAPGAAPTTGTVRPGTVPLQDPNTGEWVWVLPDCSKSLPPGTACVLSRTKDNAGRVIVTIQLAPGDPTWW